MRKEMTLKRVAFIISTMALNNTSCLVLKPSTILSSSNALGSYEQEKHIFSVPLTSTRQEGQQQNSPNNKKFSETFWELWNDKRAITSLIRDNRNTLTEEKEYGGESSINIPYCIKSEELDVKGSQFKILLYPRGVFSSTSDITSKTPASAYLSYLPLQYGDEVDVYWKIRLINNETGISLPIVTSGGLPRSNDTFSSAMTFCARNEAVDSVGRTCDWGSSVWNSKNVCDILLSSSSSLCAEIEICMFGVRSGETSISMFSWPPKGGLGAVIQRATDVGVNRTFRAGEVIVPLPNTNNDDSNTKLLQKMGVYSGIDYRVMTIADEQGNSIFSTESSIHKTKLALRPTGWKLQQKLWKTRGFQDWPIEVDAQLLASYGVSSRYNLNTFLPRLKTTIAQETRSVLLTLLLALSPLFLTFVGREFISIYAIPSASMEPTLQKGDVLLVEKFPHINDRIQRGNIILFYPPPTLERIIQNSNNYNSKKKQLFEAKLAPLFVKRVVGMPGDTNILMNDNTQEVTIQNIPVAGPDRNLCDDEPLRLIDKLLNDYGKGKFISNLNDDELFVLGDCKAVSVDSRVFGVLPKNYVVGKPIGRIWPLQRFTFGQL